MPTRIATLRVPNSERERASSGGETPRSTQSLYYERSLDYCKRRCGSDPLDPLPVLRGMFRRCLSDRNDPLSNLSTDEARVSYYTNILHRIANARTQWCHNPRVIDSRGHESDISRNSVRRLFMFPQEDLATFPYVRVEAQLSAYNFGERVPHNFVVKRACDKPWENGTPYHPWTFSIYDINRGFRLARRKFPALFEKAATSNFSNGNGTLIMQYALFGSPQIS